MNRKIKLWHMDFFVLVGGQWHPWCIPCPTSLTCRAQPMCLCPASTCSSASTAAPLPSSWSCLRTTGWEQHFKQVSFLCPHSVVVWIIIFFTLLHCVFNRLQKCMSFFRWELWYETPMVLIEVSLFYPMAGFCSPWWRSKSSSTVCKVLWGNCFGLYYWVIPWTKTGA